MKAIFNKNCMIVGWYDPQNKNVFNKELQWIGFINDSYFFSESIHWIGGFVKGTFVDKNGRPVAWIEGSIPTSANKLSQPITPIKPLSPLTPLRPLLPLVPLRPLTPIGGWSELEWKEYLKPS